jgi:hypothetical protein
VATIDTSTMTDAQIRADKTLTKDQKAKAIFDNGYKKAVQNGTLAANNTDPTGAIHAVSNSVGNLQTIAANLSRPTFLERIGIGFLGLLFIWWSILFALAQNKQVQTLAKTALKSNPETAIPATIAETAIGS